MRGFKLAPWDWEFYAEQVRKAKYDLDESQTKPYLELEHVLENGVFYAANQLYGVTFKRRTDIPATNRTCASTKCSTRTASRWGWPTSTTSSVTTRRAAPG